MDISLFTRSHASFHIDEVSTMSMSKRLMQEGQEGEESNRVVAKSRLARNLVALALSMSPSQSNSDPIPESAGTRGILSKFARPKVRGNLMRRLRAPRTRTALKRGNEQINTERPIAPSIQVDGIARDLQRDLSRFGDMFRIQGKNVEEFFVEKFKVAENAQYRFSMNEAIWGISMNSCMWSAVHMHEDRGQTQSVLRNMDVQEIQQICTTSPNLTVSLRRKNCSVCMISRSGVRASGGRVHCFTETSANISPQKCVSFQILCCVLVGSARNILNQQ